jgi:transcriptional regulator with XRE-family HTH domain
LNKFSNRIRTLRRRQGLTQAQLAKLIGVAQPYITEIEKGRKRPSVEVLEKLCDSLGGSADYLLDVTPSRFSTLKQDSCGLSPEMISEIARSGVTDEEMRLALKLARVMREEENQAL